MSKQTPTRVQLSHTLANMAKRVFVALLVLVTLISVYSITRANVPVAEAAAPTTLNFQARLLNTSGSLVADGTYNVEFKLYNASAPDGGETPIQGSCTTNPGAVADEDCLWTETRTGGNKIQVKNGYLSAYLGDITSLPTNIWNQQLYLTMNIGGTGAASWDGEMTPRIRLTSVPYAFRATVAESAETLSKNTGSFTGTVDFGTMTANRTFLFPDTSLATTASPGTICVYNGAASNCPAASGSAYYIQNDTVLQTASNFHIQARNSTTNGTIGGVISGAAGGQTVDLLQFRASDDSTVLAAVTAAGNLQVASSVDTYTATTLGVGNSTATAVSICNSAACDTISIATNADADTVNIGDASDTLNFVGTAINITGDTAINSNVTVAAGKYISLAGGNTASRPGSPTEGMMYYDTTTKQLLVYANGKWQGDRSTATKIVAASNSSQTIKDSADYIADGTGDQVEINAALTAAAGGKVYLAEGTYVANATILVPNNTVISGAGRGTLIELADLDATDNLIENSDTTTGTGVRIQDLRIDGRNDLNTAGTQYGIYLNGLGSGNGASARPGGVVSGVAANNFRDYGIFLTASSNNIVTGNRAQNNTVGGFGLNAGSNYTTFTGNNAQGSTYGVVVGSAGNTITGNTVQGHTNTGIYLVGGQNNAITGNAVSGNAGTGIALTTNSSNNTVTGNKIYDSGAATNNNAIYITGSDSNTIAANNINDTSATTTNYAIYIFDSTSDTNYLSDNTLGGGGINDAGTGTIYGGQLNGSTNYLIQPAGTIELMKNTNVTGTLAATVALHSPLLDTATNVALGIGTTNATNITIGRNAGTLQLDGTNFDLGTNGVMTLAGGQTADITTQANQNLTVVANGSGTIVLNDTVTVGGTMTFSNVATDITTGTNEDLTVDANGTGKLVINDNTDIAAGASFATRKATSDYTTAGSANNVAISGSSLVRLDTSGAAQTITGIAAGRDGQYLTLINTDASNAVTLSNNSGSSSDGNKIITGTGADVTLPAGGTLSLIYESTGTAATSFWRVIGATSNSGGGANQQLSNLSGTVAINLSLLANDDNGKDLGSSTNSWRTLYADTSVLTPNVDVATAGALGVGNSTATSVSICNSAACDTIQVGTNGDADTISVGDATDTVDILGVTTINNNVNVATNINTGSNNALVTIGGGNGTFSLQTSNIDISNAGAITGATGFSFASGAYNMDLSASSGTFSSTTGTATFNGDVVVAAGKYLKLSGGNTASRPGSPTEGMLYYDTETDQLLIYNGTKWLAESRDAYLVAANNSSAADKAAADYIADGTADEVEINAALLRADPASATGGARKSGKVYLFAGTYTTADTISIPNNTTLSGAGKGTLIQFGNLGGVSKNMITNTTTGGNGTGITIRDLRLDGNKSTNSTDTFSGIYLNGMGSVTTNLPGASITSVAIQNFENYGIHLVTVANNIITDNTIQFNDDHGILTNDSNHDIITNNIITDNSLNGIYFNTTARDLVSGNIIRSNGNYGIRIETGNTNIITDNILRSNTGSGSTSSIYLTNTDTNLITNNSITDTAGTGYAIDISDAGSDSNYLSNNTFSGTGATSINDASGGDTIYAGQNNGTSYYLQPNDDFVINGVGNSTVSTASGNLQLQTTTSGNITLTTAQSSGLVNVLTGNLKVGNGTPDLTQDGEDAYIEGTLEVDGTARFDTGVLTASIDTVSAGALAIGNSTATSVSICNSAACDTISIGTNADADTIQIGDSNDTLTFAGTLGVTGGSTFTGNVSIAGNLTVTNAGNTAFQNGATADFTTGGTLTDFAIGTGTLFRFDGASAQTISSIAGGADGRVITLINASATHVVTIQNDTGGTAGNRIITGTGGSLSVPVGATVQLAYDSDSSRWRVIGSTATNGGGANQQLSNLSGTVAVNASLTTGADNTIDLGSSSFSWRTLYADTSILSPRVDTDSATTLLIGNTTANAISISRTGVTTTVNGALTVTQAGTFNGGLSVASNLTVTQAGNVAFQRNTTDFTTTGSSDDVNLGTGVMFRLNGASAQTITSIAGGVDGRVITLINAGANAATIQNDSSGTAANRIITGTGGNLSVPTGASIQLAYDSSASRWRVIGGSAVAGGGANQQLSNLSGTVAVNLGLVAGTDNAIDLGSSSFGWRSLYADTSVLTPNLDTATATALNIGTSTASSIVIGQTGAQTIRVGQNGGTLQLDGTNFDLSTAGVITLAGGQTSDITTAAASTAAGITIKPGNSTGSNIAGPALTLQGGAATAGNANGGAVTIAGGAGFGTGTQGLINLSTTAFSTSLVQTFGSSGVQAFNNPDNSIINAFSTIPVTASTTGVIVSVPDPAQSTIGRIVYIAARSGSNDFTIRMNAARTPIDIAMKANSTATLIWNGTDWTAAGASSSTDLQSAYNNTLTSAGGAEIVLNASGGAADGFTIRNNGTTPISGGILEVQSSIGTNLFSVNNLGTELAANGGAETLSTFTTNWTAAPISATIARTTTAGQYVTGQAGVSVATTSTTLSGVRNNLSNNPVNSIGAAYQVSFAAKSSVNGSQVQVRYSRNGGTNMTACSAYGTGTGIDYATLSNTTWTKVTCTITIDSATAATDPDLYIEKIGATTPTLYVDNLSFIRTDTTTQPSNVQIGGGINGGPITLFTLDRSSAPPVANGDTNYLGSMYYDTTTGRIQCYESDGWGACGSAPDNIITLTPEYTGAVLNGNGVGVMTADFCANQATILVVGSLCSVGEARNFYRWTSPQATLQTYDIYVTYKLPTTFKQFADNNTMKLTAYRDDADDADALVRMATYRKDVSGGDIELCGTQTDITNSVSAWEPTSVDGSENSCNYTGGDYIIFKITMSSRNNSNVYVENLDFTYSNR